MKVFHIVCMVLMIAMMQHTCLADEQTEIIYGDGWTHYLDGTQAHKLAPTNYLRWDGEWRPKTEMNISSGDWPYLVEEFETYYFITRLDDSLTLSKIYRTYYFQPYKIGVQLILTPAQLNGMSTYHNVGGTDYWYISIKQSWKQTGKHLNWDNKLPVVRNNTLVNYIDEFGEDYTAYGTLNQSNFGYRIIAGELRFYYNQDARTWGSSSDLVIFNFNSYIINSSSGWVNTSYSNFAYDRNTGYLILSDNVTGGLVLYQKMSGSTGITSYDMNLTSNNNGTLTNMNTGLDNGSSGWNSSGKYGNALGFDGENDYVDCGNDESLNITDNLTVGVWINFDSVATIQRFISKREGNNGYLFQWNEPTNELQGGIKKAGAWKYAKYAWTPITGTWYHVAYTYDGADIRLYLDGTLRDTEPVVDGLGGTGNPLLIGALYTLTDWFGGCIDSVRIYNRALANDEINQTINNTMKTSDNVTHWYDTGAGYQGSQFKFVFNNDSNSFLEGWVSADNSTWYQVTDNVINDTLMNIPALYKNQTQYIRAVLKGNGTSTPEEIEAWIVSESVGPGPTPTPAPAISVSPAQYDELDLPLILYILMISMLYLFIAFRIGAATIELSLIYLIFAFIFLLFQTVTISVNNIYLILFLLLFMISIAGITLEKRSW